MAHPVLFPGMAVALILGAALLTVAAYFSWLAGELGLGPRWRGRRSDAGAGELEGRGP